MVNIIEKAVAASKFNPTINIPGDGDIQYTFFEYVSAWVNYLVKFLGPVLAMIMIVVSGILYLTSRGDDNQVTKAKDLLTGAIVGYLLLIFLRLIFDLLGAKYSVN
jgi:hypothetical protein